LNLKQPVFFFFPLLFPPLIDEQSAGFKLPFPADWITFSENLFTGAPRPPPAISHDFRAWTLSFTFPGPLCKTLSYLQSSLFHQDISRTPPPDVECFFRGYFCLLRTPFLYYFPRPPPAVAWHQLTHRAVGGGGVGLLGPRFRWTPPPPFPQNYLPAVPPGERKRYFHEFVPFLGPLSVFYTVYPQRSFSGALSLIPLPLPGVVLI